MQKRPVALIGCGLLVLGVFAPVIQVPFAGASTYLEFGRNGTTPAGLITLFIAAGSVFAVFAQRYSLLWGTGIASLVVEGWALWRAREIISGLRANADGLRGTLADAMQLQWGWAVLAAGGIALLLAAGLAMEERKALRASG